MGPSRAIIPFHIRVCEHRSNAAPQHPRRAALQGLTASIRAGCSTASAGEAQTAAPHRTAPTRPHRTAPHRTAPQDPAARTHLSSAACGRAEPALPESLSSSAMKMRGREGKKKKQQKRPTEPRRKSADGGEMEALQIWERGARCRSAASAEQRARLPHPSAPQRGAGAVGGGRPRRSDRRSRTAAAGTAQCGRAQRSTVRDKGLRGGGAPSDRVGAALKE